MSTDEKQVNAKNCAHCGVEFTPKRSTAKFCGDSCRVGAHLKRMRAADDFKLRRRRGIGASFDGRTGGALRDVGRNRPQGYAARHAAVNHA